MLDVTQPLVAGNDNIDAIALPSVQELYDLAQAEELFPGVERVLFDQVPRLMLYAAIDPVSYSAQAHKILEQVGVSEKCRRFDDLGIKEMIRKRFEALSPRSSDSEL